MEDLFKGFGTQEIYTSESTDEDGNTILNAAAKWGHKRLVRRALKWACDVNHMNDDGLTAVEMAVRGALMYWCIGVLMVHVGCTRCTRCARCTRYGTLPVPTTL